MTYTQAVNVRGIVRKPMSEEERDDKSRSSIKAVSSVKFASDKRTGGGEGDDDVKQTMMTPECDEDEVPPLV